MAKKKSANPVAEAMLTAFGSLLSALPERTTREAARTAADVLQYSKQPLDPEAERIVASIFMLEREPE
jgi:hypothetical protein